ncbi:MAG: 4Fe-4S binding protein [Thermodesulfobacteriota bacterium]|nr:4Fe-4S binding protein [Thermodesulfobacteriota bacterium]
MVIVHEDLCAVCGQCHLVCEVDAIEGWAAPPQIDEDTCIECYECVDYCPTEALEVKE